MTQEVSERSTFLKKYLIKRQRTREGVVQRHLNIFANRVEGEETYDNESDPFKKYQTLSTGIGESSIIPFSTVETTSSPVRSCRNESRLMLSNESIRPKLSQQGVSINSKILQQLTPVRAKQRELDRHVSDPFYMRLQKMKCPKVHQKHRNYRKGWLEMTLQRRGQSLVDNSFEQASKNMAVINEDARRRRNTNKLEEMLRDNISEKTFIELGLSRPDIKGLRGKGGRSVSLFQEIRVVEEVLKFNRS